ncbi:cellulase family glycosylhydrolase [Aquimarina sp. ERC-38]|uniref:cellulase family glycosylhydrolase n=1 Tax=Aquimarina sp. ERC-38 TaxID=2949996 RepID=UPI00224632FD|nr:cellulase family glycosylhydrolase [Aquimarina sp. ERC-38]UZO80808.1 cellulase family glycosylhydrolase [Aquimarina sp. ERC-38]
MNTGINYLKQVVALGFILLLTSNLDITAQNGAVGKFGRLQVNGNKVTAEDGTEISLAGMSLFWSNAAWTLSDFYNKETVDHLANNWNASIVRAAVGVTETWDGGRGYIGNGTDFYAAGREWKDAKEFNLVRLEAVIDAAIANDIYVIVDWHTHEAEKYVNEAVEFFGYISKKYGSNDHIIYEIYNEPYGARQGNPKTSWSTIKNYSRPVIAEIRKNDKDNLIVVGTSTWSQDVDEPAADQNWINDPNIAYALHFYANTADHQQPLRNKAKLAMDAGIALFVTEFGSVSADGNGGFNRNQTNQWINFLKNNKVSFVNWSLSDLNETSAVITAKADPSNPSNSDLNGVQRFLNNDLTAPGNFMKSIVQQQNTLSAPEVILNGEQIKIYPLPAEDRITIEAEDIINTISILDLTGKLLVTQQVSKLNPEVSTEALTTGNYILKIEANGKTASALITKK